MKGILGNCCFLLQYSRLSILLRQAFLVLIFGGFTTLSAQDYTINIQNYTVEDGLLHRSIRSIFEDHDGVIWVGSKKGIQRFDGHQFRSWTKADSTGLIFNITTIGQDQEGWLWLWNNTLRSFVFLHPQSEAILSVEERFGEDFPIFRQSNNIGWHNTMPIIPQDTEGRLCFLMSSPNEIITYDAQEGFVKQPIRSIQASSLKLKMVDSKNNLWVTTPSDKHKLYKIDHTGNLLQKYNHPNENAILGITEIQNAIYYKTRRGNQRVFRKIDEKQNVQVLSTKLLIPKGVRYYLSFIWDRTATGWTVTTIDQTDTLFNLPLKELPKSFSSLNLDIQEDSKHRFWFASEWGLGVATLQPRRFKKYFSFTGDADQPINNSARGILVANDTIYVNFEFGGLVSIPIQNPNHWNLLDTSINQQYKGKPIARGKKGEIYVGNESSIVKYSTAGFKTQRAILSSENSLPSMIWSFYTDTLDQLWIGMNRGLAYKKPGDSYYQVLPTGNAWMTVDELTHICPSPEGLLWLSSTNRLTTFDPKTKTVLHSYSSKEKGEYFLPAQNYHYLYIDLEGIYWVGTNEGLLRWDKKQNTKRLFTTIDGLSNDVIYAIFEDDQHKLWLSSDYGIMQFDKENFQVKAYLEKDGITQHEFNRTAAFQAEDGTIYFGGLNGITAFHPKNFQQQADTEQLKMYLSSFEVFDGTSGKLVNKGGELRATNTIEFKPEDRYFRLSFALLAYENMAKINYAWKIEGVDSDWHYQKENTLQIGKLPYGNYTLRIKGQTDNGQWSNQELTLKVKVLRPFYLQLWFLILASLLLVAAIFLFYKWRIRRLKIRQQVLEAAIKKATAQIAEQAAALKELDKTKSRFFANVSHELRTPLTLMLGPISSVLKNNNLQAKDFTYLKKAQQNGRDLLKLVASILNLSKMESGKLELQEKTVLLFPLLRRIISAFESHAQREGIFFSFIYRPANDLQLELDKEKLEVVLNNLLSNALKFSTRGGKVIIEVEDKSNAILLTVKDNGRGIHPTDLPHVFNRFYQSRQADTPTEGGTGIGLALSREFVKMMQGEIWVKSELGLGSTFCVSLPRKEVLGVPITQEVLAVDQNQTELEELTAARKDKTLATVDSKTCILVVEDNYSLSDYLASILSPFYLVVTKENGQSALNYLNENQTTLPALILSDIMMPVMDGFQLLQRLKSQQEFRHLPVIMLTARADASDKIKALRIGVDDYLLKPFEEDELLARVENILKNYQERLSAQIEYATTEEVQKVDTTHDVPVFSTEDEIWLAALAEHLQKEFKNNKYSITQLAFDMAISERQLRRRVKLLTGLSPTKYLKETRLQAARHLLEQHKFKTVAQTARAVGFQDAGAFSRNFTKRFGKTPSAYLH
ncbi:MAG: ATP-binding protein [Saprospiraceae bacterium]